jgi:WD40 repeat protein
VWDWRRGEVVHTVDTWADDVAFDRTGTRIATGTIGGHVEIWDLAERRRRATLTGHGGVILRIAFSPDGSRIATSGSDATVRLWDADSAVQLLALEGHTSMVWDVEFSPDGSKLASASPDGTVRVWALDRDDLISLAEARLTRDLTDDECRQYLHVESCPPA